MNIASHGGHTDVVALLIAARCNMHLAENVIELHPSIFSGLCTQCSIDTVSTLSIYEDTISLCIYLSIYQLPLPPHTHKQVHTHTHTGPHTSLHTLTQSTTFFFPFFCVCVIFCAPPDDGSDALLGTSLGWKHATAQGC